MTEMIGVDSPSHTQIKKVLAEVDNIKPLPTTVTRALELIDEPDIAIKQIVSALAVDQALAIRILRQANSAYYGFTCPASTLQEAITRLGFRRTKNILLTVSYSSLLGRRLASYNLGQGDLWQHSIAVAMTAQRLADRVGYPNPDEAYLGGLLHDIGKLVLAQHFKVEWDQLLEMGATFDLDLVKTEERLFGMNHAQVGGELATKWELPACLIEAIRYHHLPLLATEWAELAAIVHLANIICLRLDIGLSDPIFLVDPNPEALRLLALEMDEVDRLTDLYKDMVELAGRLMEI